MHHFFVSPAVYEKHSEPPLPSKISVFSVFFSAVPLSTNLDDLFTNVTGPRSIGIKYMAVFVTRSPDLLGKKKRLLPLTETIFSFPPGGYSIYPSVGRCGPALHALTLFKTNIADFPTLFKTISDF